MSRVMVKKRKKRERSSLTERKDNGGTARRTFTIGMGRKIIFGKKSTGKGIFHQDEEGHLLALRSKLPWWDVPCLVLFSTPIMKRDQQHERTEIANTTGEKK